MLAREGQTRVAGRLVSLGLASKHAHERWEARSEQLGQRLRLEPGEDVVVLAVEEDLAIILDNLIENALHYSPEGSSVTIEFGREGTDAYLAVLDDGPGIADGEEEAVFERFRRGSASKSSSGTGLGLAIVQTLAQRWGGRASLSARPEGGTRAEIRLPAGDALPTPNPELGRTDRRPLLDWMTQCATTLTLLAVALVGLFGAASLGYAAYVVSRDQVGLPVTKLKTPPGSLAPTPAKTTKQPTPKRKRVVPPPPPPPPPARRLGSRETTTAVVPAAAPAGSGSGHGGRDD